jgi:hypothetical protein
MSGHAAAHCRQDFLLAPAQQAWCPLRTNFSDADVVAGADVTLACPFAVTRGVGEAAGGGPAGGVNGSAGQPAPAPALAPVVLHGQPPPTNFTVSLAALVGASDECHSCQECLGVVAHEFKPQLSPAMSAAEIAERFYELCASKVGDSGPRNGSSGSSDGQQYGNSSSSSSSTSGDGGQYSSGGSDWQPFMPGSPSSQWSPNSPDVAQQLLSMLASASQGQLQGNTSVDAEQLASALLSMVSSQLGQAGGMPQPPLNGTSPEQQPAGKFTDSVPPLEQLFNGSVDIQQLLSSLVVGLQQQLQQPGTPHPAVNGSEPVDKPGAPQPGQPGMPPGPFNGSDPVEQLVSMLIGMLQVGGHFGGMLPQQGQFPEFLPGPDSGQYGNQPGQYGGQHQGQYRGPRGGGRGHGVGLAQCAAVRDAIAASPRGRMGRRAGAVCRALGFCSPVMGVHCVVRLPAPPGGAPGANVNASAANTSMAAVTAAAVDVCTGALLWCRGLVTSALKWRHMKWRDAHVLLTHCCCCLPPPPLPLPPRS